MVSGLLIMPYTSLFSEKSSSKSCGSAPSWSRWLFSTRSTVVRVLLHTMRWNLSLHGSAFSAPTFVFMCFYIFDASSHLPCRRTSCATGISRCQTSFMVCTFKFEGPHGPLMVRFAYSPQGKNRAMGKRACSLESFPVPFPAKEYQV